MGKVFGEDLNALLSSPSVVLHLPRLSTGFMPNPFAQADTGLNDCCRRITERRGEGT